MKHRVAIEINGRRGSCPAKRSCARPRPRARSSRSVTAPSTAAAADYCFGIREAVGLSWRDMYEPGHVPPRGAKPDEASNPGTTPEWWPTTPESSGVLVVAGRAALAGGLHFRPLALLAEALLALALARPRGAARLRTVRRLFDEGDEARASGLTVLRLCSMLAAVDEQDIVGDQAAAGEAPIRGSFTSSGSDEVPGR